MLGYDDDGGIQYTNQEKKRNMKILKKKLKVSYAGDVMFFPVLSMVSVSIYEYMSAKNMTAIGYFSNFKNQ